MKKIFLVILQVAFLLGIIPATVSALPGQIWVGSASSGVWESECHKAAHLNAAIGRFEGLLNAYSVNQNQNIANRLSTAANDLSSSLEQFNIALIEVYPTLSEEEQLAVRNAYSSLGLYLEDLATETNSVFGREVFRIIKLQDGFYGEVESELWPAEPWA